ncbi:MAG: FAD-dependent oxidoreductase [Pseudomonadota bacterium]
MTTSKKSNKVLVVGGGVGGIKTALDLAEAGRDVVLIDKAPSIGGLMTQLDRTFPTNNCDMCTVSPHLAESGRELHIELLPLTEATACEGEAGAFSVTLNRKPRYIDLEKCTACGECRRLFPECVNFTPGLDPRAPTCMRYPQATPLAYSIDAEKCGNLEEVAKACQFGAILTKDEPREMTIEVGAVVLAPGAGLFDPKALLNYGHGMYPNVVTGLEYERIMSASGPTEGRLARPSDGKQPLRVAWIQCVGSRNINQADAPYCSSACCMYALKEAIITKERFKDDIETVVFYMDMRTFGKDYELYLNRAVNDYKVRLVRSRPHSVDRLNDSDDLAITYTVDEDSKHRTETFDMVVLATGFKVPPDAAELGKTFGIELTKHNFAQTTAFEPVACSKPGVFVCGLFESPKDIPETMVQASAAAGLASKFLGRGGEFAAEEFEDDEIPERDVSDEAPKVGVFVCDCGFNIGGVVDTDAVVRYAQTLPGVAMAEMVGHGCSSESILRIQEAIGEKQLNRVVLAGCSPRTHEIKFQDVLRKAGLNKYLFEMANIRDQDSWVHLEQPGLASSKAKDLVRMAVAGVASKKPLKDNTLPMNKDVLVIGGGVAGMSASLNLADDGFRVFLVERASELGGLAAKIKKTLEGDDVGAFVKGLVEKVKGQKNIQVITDAVVADHSGMPGLFKTGIQRGPQMAYRQIDHGVTILATGALANRPREYYLGESDAVVTQLDLDRLLEEDPDRIKALKRVVMIQCVGSRVPENPNCSRVCCQAAVKNALRILELNPEMKIFVLYRDMRTYGFQEEYFRLAREKGVIFSRYDLDRKPRVEKVGAKAAVTFLDPVLGLEVSVEADLLALSAGFVADDESTEDLAAIFHLPRTGDGYFLEEHVKLRPVDLPVPGFLVAGTAHSPRSVRESIAQGLAAGGRAKAMLARDSINLGASVARVDGEKCAACLICVRACPYGVPFINADGYSQIDPAKCRGCGICAAECPAKAIQLMQFEDDSILAKVDGLLEGLLLEGVL